MYQTSGISLLLLLAMLACAAALDLRHHRIPNLLTYPAMCAGLLLAAIGGGMTAFGNHLLGLLAGGLPLFILFLGRTLGGGDVKLMAAVGALVGFPAVLNALIAAILVGGLCAALILIWQGRLIPMLRYSWATVWHRAGVLAQAPPPLPPHSDSFPFGVAIAIGTCLAVFSHGSGNLL